MRSHKTLRSGTLVVSIASLFVLARATSTGRNRPGPPAASDGSLVVEHALATLEEGRRIFRSDTFGDEAYWGDTLHLHKAIEGDRFGGVGAGVSPRTALAVGLKVDMDALPPPLQNQLRAGRVNLDDPATTLALLEFDAVVGVTGYPKEQVTAFLSRPLGELDLPVIMLDGVCLARSTNSQRARSPARGEAELDAHCDPSGLGRGDVRQSPQEAVGSGLATR